MKCGYDLEEKLYQCFDVKFDEESEFYSFESDKSSRALNANAFEGNGLQIKFLHILMHRT